MAVRARICWCWRRRVVPRGSPLPFAANAADWKPDKRVEIIVPSGPGGGNDRVARLVHKVIQDGKLVDAVTAVVNKPGGGATIGYAYLNQHPGDGHFLVITSVTLIADYLTGRATISHTDLTPVAQLFTEYVAFAVRPDSKFRTGKDLLAALKTDAGSVSAAIATSLGNHNHAALGLVARAAGGDARRLKIAVFNSGSDSLSAALGGHVDLVVIPAATALPHMQAGRIRFIAVTSPAAPRRTARRGSNLARAGSERSGLQLARHAWAQVDDPAASRLLGKRARAG